MTYNYKLQRSPGPVSSSEEDDDTKFLFGAVNTALRGGDGDSTMDNSSKNGKYVRVLCG
jgi:hypothetical protein